MSFNTIPVKPVGWLVAGGGDGGGGGCLPAMRGVTLHALVVVTLRNLYW